MRPRYFQFTPSQLVLSVRIFTTAVLLVVGTLAPLSASEPIRILFIGNSFTFGALTAVPHYHPESVSDLNASGIGGVPALFAAFTAESHLTYAVSS
jgi:hypothetical protein